MNAEILNVCLCALNIGIVQDAGVLFSNSFLFVSARGFQIPNIILPQRSSRQILCVVTERTSLSHMNVFQSSILTSITVLKLFPSADSSLLHAAHRPVILSCHSHMHITSLHIRYQH